MAGFATKMEEEQQCAQGVLRAASWNVAAINNNPFEYWITHDDPKYNEMMRDVEVFINEPGEADVPVEEVFTHDMYKELHALWAAHGWGGLEETDAMWEADFSKRRIVSEFIKDAEIGSKRLASMPDRITNTINLADGSQAHRPTPINCFGGTFADMGDWWAQWKRFMFQKRLEVSTKAGPEAKIVADMLLPIKRAKYPALSEAEEAISLPLQTLCGAIFDAILVHMLDRVAPGTWQPLRHELSAALNRNKIARTLEILDTTYGDVDVFFLQEVANAFGARLSEHPTLAKRFFAVVPETSGKRDQNSVLLLRADRFEKDSVKDVTGLVMSRFEGKSVPVAEGDAVAATVRPVGSGKPVLLASFHGDTNGLATLPVLQAVHEVAQDDLGGESPLLFGLDANTYENAKPGKTQCVREFGEAFKALGMASAWPGDQVDPKEYTTFNARTFLQPQLNKAASKSQFMAKGDVNPKDFILFYASDFTVQVPAAKDNTGEGEWLADTPFPTLRFPSDHAIISSTLASPRL